MSRRRESVELEHLEIERHVEGLVLTTEGLRLVVEGNRRDFLDRIRNLIECDECNEEATSFYDSLVEPVKLCDSCEHNARRSGWEPGR